MTHAFHTRRSSDLKRKSTANAAERREGSDPSADRSGVELRLLGVTLRPQVTPPLAKPATHLSGQRRTARCARAGLARPASIAQPRRPLCTHHRDPAHAPLCQCPDLDGQIATAACRARVCHYVSISLVGETIKKNEAH